MTGSMLEKAIKIAVQAHHGQVDKAGAPYILHLLRVMLRMNDETEMIVGVLHDILEDTHWTAADLEAEGFPPEVVRVIRLLSKSNSESYEAFIARLAPDPLARRVKITDLEDNMDIRRVTSLSEEDWARLTRYQQARKSLKEWKVG